MHIVPRRGLAQWPLGSLGSRHYGGMHGLWGHFCDDLLARAQIDTYLFPNLFPWQHSGRELKDMNVASHPQRDRDPQECWDGVRLGLGSCVNPRVMSRKGLSAAAYMTVCLLLPSFLFSTRPSSD